MRFHLSVAMVLWLAGASPASAATADTTAKKAPIVPVDHIQVLYVLHFAPEPRGDVVKLGQDLVRSKFPTLKVLTMWVEVSSWKGSAIVGLLNNEPEDVPGLHAGATVKVNEKDVFDYLLNKADGSVEGNETGKEIEKFQMRQ